jgi:purine-cytosine permease-like protein
VNWLVGYSALVGPMLGVVLADYYLVRGRTLQLDDLYSRNVKGQYWYQVGAKGGKGGKGGNKGGEDVTGVHTGILFVTNVTFALMYPRATYSGHTLVASLALLSLYCISGCHR